MSNSNDKQLLDPLLSEPATLAAEYRKRKRDYVYKSVNPKNVQEYYEKGWEHDKNLKTKIRIKYLKGFDERFENKVWRLFYEMGYSEMNEGRQFKVSFKRSGKIHDQKQIDVFAKDDETVLFVECKASEISKHRVLQNDIEAFANKKGYFANSVKKYYGNDYKPKILWFFITENIRWSRADRERAESERIQIISEREFRYYKEVVNHLGPAARYQFLAEFLKGQEIPELSNTILPAIRGKLGGKKFYCFVTTPKQLLKIAFVNHRALDDPDGYPTYQRLVEKGRRKKIAQYLENNGFFPTNLLINFSQKVRFDPIHKDEENDIHYGQLYLPNKYKSAWIIDGQHRLYGYSGLDEYFLKQNIMVLAFEKLPRVEEANLFVTINAEQKKVHRSLLDDLEGDLKWDSDKPTERIGAIAARLIKSLNADLGEPFYNRITAQGFKATDQMCLTLPEIKDGLKRSRLIGTAIMKKNVYERGPLCDQEDEGTLVRARLAVNLYFSLIKEANVERWESGRPGCLCTNPGIRGSLMLLASLVHHIETERRIDAKELEPLDIIAEIEEYLEPILLFISEASDTEFEELFKVKYGSGGSSQYYFRLCEKINEETPSFSPEGYDDWIQSQSEQRIRRADEIVKDLQNIIPAYIFNKFKEVYGAKRYLEEGVRDIDMRTAAYKSQQQSDPSTRTELEAYFEFLQLKKIVEKRYNWPFLKDVFNIPLPGRKGLTKNLEWMDRINSLRRVSAHGAYKRSYALADFSFLEWIYDEFQERVRAAPQKEEIWAVK